MNSLLKKIAFEVITILNIFNKIRIFNFCFVNKNKNERILIAFEKSRLIVETYNNHKKRKI